jgi:hypothetical protein
MKFLKPVFLLLIPIVMQGCAHYGTYRGSYVGYGGGYSGMQGYYGYPGNSYYRSGPVIHYDRGIPAPSHPRHYDWRPQPTHPPKYKPPVHHDNRPMTRWQPHNPGRDWHDNNRPPHNTRNARPESGRSAWRERSSSHTAPSSRNMGRHDGEHRKW